MSKLYNYLSSINCLIKTTIVLELSQGLQKFQIIKDDIGTVLENQSVTK